MTDYNVRNVFFLFTGKCGHRWVGDTAHCPGCGVVGMDNVTTYEPITVYCHPDTLRKMQRRIKRAIREGRRKPRKTAAVISLATHRTPPPSEPPGCPT
jgi:hypothetical protein